MVPKRQKTLLALMLGALGALCLGQAAALLAERPPQTVTARLYMGEEPVCVSGVVIRQEVPVTAPVSGSWTALVSDGQQVSAGQTLAAWETAENESARTVRLLRAGQAVAQKPVISRRQALREAIQALSGASGQDRRAASEDLTGLLLGQSGPAETGLAEAEEQLTARPAAASVSAPVSGVFSAECDGLEELLTPDSPWTEWSLPLRPVNRQAVGRLITGDTWYFRTELETVPEVGQTLTVRLLSGIFETAELTVEACRGSQVLLSCETALAAVAGLRQLEIRILPDQEPGVELPAEAVKMNDGQAGVWCLVGDAVRFKPVTIFQYLGDTVVAELDQTTTDALWPGDEILLEDQ